MQAFKKLLSAFLSVLQVIFLAAIFILNYYGSHRMGAHRHMKVRGQQYFSGILSGTNLTIATIVISVILVSLICYLLKIRKDRPQPKKLWSALLGVFLTLLLLSILVLPTFRGLLIFPWLLLCAVIIFLLQLVKMLLLIKSTSV